MAGVQRHYELNSTDFGHLHWLVDRGLVDLQHAMQYAERFGVPRRYMGMTQLQLDSQLVAQRSVTLQPAPEPAPAPAPAATVETATGDEPEPQQNASQLPPTMVPETFFHANATANPEAPAW